MAAGVNPLVILTKLQKEAGIISKESATGLGAALRCACPDGGGCSSSSAGFQS